MPHQPHARRGLCRVDGPNAEKLVEMLLVDGGLVFEQVGASRVLPIGRGTAIGL